MKVYKSGHIIDMPYEDICHDLGFAPETHFVEVNRSGSISFSVGKPQEIRHLIRMIKEKGYRMTRDLFRMSVDRSW